MEQTVVQRYIYPALLSPPPTLQFADQFAFRRRDADPAQFPGIARSRSLKMLAVDISDDFSVGQHVQRLTTSSAQTLYALRVLRCHGLSDAALQNIYRATVIARLTYAASGSPRRPIDSAPSASTL